MEDRWRRKTRSLAVAFLVALLAATPLCSVVVDAAAVDAAAAKVKTVAAVGAGECADCASKNIKISDAFQGLSVVINCKAAGEGDYQSKGVGKLDKDGKFAVNLPTELLREDGELKAHCFAQLHGGGPKNAPCPTASGSIEAAKLVLKSRDGGHHTFSTGGKLSFSSGTCAAAWFWHHPWFKHKYPYHSPPTVYPAPVHKPPPVYHQPPAYTPPVYHPAPPVYTPPVYHPAPPVYHPPPVYTPPVYHPAPPVYTPPVYHPAPPVYTPPVYHPPTVYKPTPIYNKPPCPPLYIYKPPIPKLPPFPPVYTKPWPKFPPVYTKPWPKLPPVYTKPWPKFPPKYSYYPHPKSWFPPSYGWPPKSASPTYALPNHPFFPPVNVGQTKP